MSVATPIPLLQNLPDVNVTLGAGVHGYSLVWDNSTAHFVLEAIAGGVTASDAQIAEWTEGGDYEMTSVTYDGDNVVTTGTVKWPARATW